MEREVTPLRHLHETQRSIEKLRIALGNRVAALERGADTALLPVPDVYARLCALAE